MNSNRGGANKGRASLVSTSCAMYLCRRGPGDDGRGRVSADQFDVAPVGGCTSAEVLRSRFAAEGFIVVDQLFDADDCDQISEAIADVRFTLDMGREEVGPLIYGPMPHAVSLPVRRWSCDPRWESIVCPLIDDPSGVRLLWEQSVNKPAGTRAELPWHQDNGYLPLEGGESISCWVALDEVDIDNGCLWVIPGSHRVGALTHDQGDDRSWFRGGLDQSVIGVPLPVPRGSVVVMSSMLLHRSGPNPSESDRRAWVLQFCGAEASVSGSRMVVDDRLLVFDDEGWLDEPICARDFNVGEVLDFYRVQTRPQRT